MTDTPSDIHELFTRFERASADLDTASLEQVFAEQFLNCDPNGAAPVSREALFQALPMRERLFASAGLGAARLVRLSADELDEHYVLARTAWALRDQSGDDALRLEATFLVRRTDAGPRIVLYLNHLDVARAVASRRDPER
jgi:hypothetical protein